LILDDRYDLYDPACADLARHFLEHEPGALADDSEAIDGLACAIQRAIEDWLGGHASLEEE
jgi:hypothetical protein